MAQSELLLGFLSNKDGFDSLDAAKSLNIDHQEVVGCIKSLSANDVSLDSIYSFKIKPCCQNRADGK